MKALISCLLLLAPLQLDYAEDLISLLHQGNLFLVKEYVSSNRINLPSFRVAKHSVLDFAISTEAGPDVDKYLIDNGCQVNEEIGKTRLSPLLLSALVSKNPDIVQLLIDSGADYLHVDSYQRTAVMLAVARPASLAGMQADDLLVDLQSEARPDAVVIGILEALLNAGASIDARDSFGLSALTIAATGSSPSVVGFLLEKGARTSVRNIFGLTPLIWAVEYNTAESVKTLIKHGASVNDKDYRGQAVIFRAFDMKSDPAVISVLAEAGADINEVDDLGQTPIMYAVQKATDLRLIDALLELDPNLTHKDKIGNDVLSLATDSKLLWGTPIYWQLNDKYWAQKGKAE
jgi:ankyrin repeat protein